MKHISIRVLISRIEEKYDTAKNSGKALLILQGVLALFAILIGGYITLPLFAFASVLILIKLKREGDIVSVISKNAAVYSETGRYPYSEKNKLDRIIDNSIESRKRHRLYSILSFVGSLILIVPCGILGGEVLFGISFVIYFAAFFYLFYFLILIRSDGVKHARIKKKYDRSLYEDIYVEIPSVDSARLYCGEKALYNKNSLQLIPYDRIERIKRISRTERSGSRTVEITELFIYAKDEKAIRMPCNDREAAWLITECIAPCNPNFIKEGLDVILK